MRKLTILLVAVNAVGHVNATLGATRALAARGHRLIFVYEKAFRGKALPFGVEEHIYAVKTEQEEAQEAEAKAREARALTPGEWIANYLLETKVLGPFSAKEKSENIWKFILSEESAKEFAALHHATLEAIELYKPDLIYYDNGTLLPAVYYSGIPWIRQVSTTPIFFEFDDRLPPGGSGLPYSGPRESWRQFNHTRTPLLQSRKFNELNIEALGYEPYPGDSIQPETQLLTVYGYPTELDYPEIREKESWFNLESFHRNSNELTKLSELIPADFIDDTLDGKFTGKWIYLSMGSMGSVDLVLMKRLILVLSKTNHKYIVSKGPRHSEYSLAENMYGGRYLPQTRILPHMDLVITHGGNNTVTETFVEGKPMIVLPLFADQFDNAQRLQETGFGARLEPYGFEAEELVQQIERLLYDEQMYDKLRAAAMRVRDSNRHEELAIKIEQLLFN